jgi:nucleoside-diphosphate-sugar epimerase
VKGAAAELFADSVVASRNLLDALRVRKDIESAQTRVVLVSSFGVYGVVPLGRGARVDESTPLEDHPELRDTYSHSKLRQEQLFWEYQQADGFELVVLRPGVIYGPGGGAFSTRVGLQIGPVFFHLGGSNLLPLSYVVNCAEAIAVAACDADSAGQVYNVHDDVEGYHRRSLGQLPGIITRYKAAAAWGGNRFSNAKLHSLGWSQLVATPDAMAKTFEYLRQKDAKQS